MRAQILFLTISSIFLFSSLAIAVETPATRALVCTYPSKSGCLSNAPTHLLCPLVPADQYAVSQTSGIISSFVFPTTVSLVTQTMAVMLTSWKAQNQQLGVEVYRGIRCFELGARGLQRLYDYTANKERTDSERAVAASQDLSVNRDMFGYLLADTIVQSALSGMRTDLLIHHVMGLTLWGSTLAYGVFPDIIAVNAAVEILSAFKGVESSVKSKLFGDPNLLRNQRILKAAYGFRLVVILGIRYPMWTLIDWPIPNERYDELGPVGWGVYRVLNVGILALETLWLYQTAKAFHQLRFF